MDHRAGREDGRPRCASGGLGPQARPSALSLVTARLSQRLSEAVAPRVCPAGADWPLVSRGLVTGPGRENRSADAAAASMSFCPAHVFMAERSQRRKQLVRILVQARHKQTLAGVTYLVGEAALGISRLLMRPWSYPPQGTSRVVSSADLATGSLPSPSRSGFLSLPGFPSCLFPPLCPMSSLREEGGTPVRPSGDTPPITVKNKATHLSLSFSFESQFLPKVTGVWSRKGFLSWGGHHAWR